MRISNLMESIANNRVRLVPDVYEDEYEAMDETEIRANFIDEEDLERDFEVKTMTAVEAQTLLEPRGDSTVIELYKDHATKDSKALVAQKAKHWDSNRIVVLCNGKLIDGFHQVVAGILTHNDIKYITLDE